MSITVQARQLDELTARIARQRRATKTDMALLVDKQLLQIRRVLKDATPVGSTADRTFTLPNGRVVTRAVAAHGSMAASWHKQSAGLSGRVWNDVPYAAYQFTGTRPHAIPGAFGYPAPFGESQTFHPGTQPNQRLVSAFEEQVADASTRFRQFGLSVAGKIAGRTVGE